MGDLLFEMALFSVVGLGLETIFTAALDWKRDPKRHLMGYSSIWYIPLYAVTPVFFQAFGPSLFGLPWPARGLIYLAVIWAMEYLGMLALRKLLGTSPSEESYYKAKWNVHGLIRLDFAPSWFAAGLAFEYFYRWLHPFRGAFPRF